MFLAGHNTFALAFLGAMAGVFLTIGVETHWHKTAFDEASSPVRLLLWVAGGFLFSAFLCTPDKRLKFGPRGISIAWADFDGWRDYAMCVASAGFAFAASYALTGYFS